MRSTCPIPAAAFAFLSAILLSAVVSADDDKPGPLEPSDTSSPRATLNSLIESCNALHEVIKSGAMSEERESEVLPSAERILDCLNLSELPKELRLTAGIESALFLKEVLDRIELPTDGEIPKVEESSENSDAISSWQIPKSRIAIARVEEGSRKNAWLFTPESVRNASQYYRIMKPFPYRTGGPSVSQGLYDSYVAATKKRPTQTADTASPRGTLTLFLESCNELHEKVSKVRYFDRNNPEFQHLGQQIVSCLDSSQLPDFAREYFDAEAAVCLKEVLDRIQLPPAEEIPGIESVETVEGAEAVVRWQVPRTQIVISKMQDGPRRGEFLFSAETVARAPEFYRKIKEQPYRADGRPVSEGFYTWWLASPGNPSVGSMVDRLPPWFRNRVLGMAFWQWLGMMLAVPIALILILVALRLGHRSDDWYARSGRLLSYWIGLILPLIAILVPVAFKYFIWEYLTLRGSPLYIASFCADVVFLFVALVLIVRASSRIAETIIALPGVAPRGLDASLIRIVCRVLGIVASIIVFLEGGRYLGFPLTTLIASAGIGGLAIALSAQGVVKSLFGTVTVLMDKPYGVGETIIAKGHEGVVEDIGLRSTKIRTLDGRLISIPNDLMAEAEIQNIGSKRFLRRISEIHIPLDTPRAKIETAVQSIREVLKDHKGMDPEMPPRVYFSGFTPESFKIALTYWYTPADVTKFKEFSERINLEIMKVFEERGIQFSLPFRHSFWKRDDEQGPLDIDVRRIDKSQKK